MQKKWVNECDLGEGTCGGRLITWAGQCAGLAQQDLLVSIHRQLQAATQLLVHRTALAAAGAV